MHHCFIKLRKIEADLYHAMIFATFQEYKAKPSQASLHKAPYTTAHALIADSPMMPPTSYQMDIWSATSSAQLWDFVK